ncbi:MAG: QsdR family transcriptional regulator, partial [Amnibacterium sp.]
MVPVAAPPRVARLGSHGTALVPSPLSTRLGTHPDATRAFREARHRFLAGERIDMGALAAVFGVDRTSLFRWVGNRDQLRAVVLWSLAGPTFEAAAAGVSTDGA